MSATVTVTAEMRDKWQRAGFASHGQCGCECEHRQKPKIKQPKHCTCGNTGQMWLLEKVEHTCPKCRPNSKWNPSDDPGFVEKKLPGQRDKWFFVCECQNTPFSKGKVRHKKFRVDPLLVNALTFYLDTCATVKSDTSTRQRQHKRTKRGRR